MVMNGKTGCDWGIPLMLYMKKLKKGAAAATCAGNRGWSTDVNHVDCRSFVDSDKQALVQTSSKNMNSSNEVRPFPKSINIHQASPSFVSSSFPGCSVTMTVISSLHNPSSWGRVWRTLLQLLEVWVPLCLFVCPRLDFSQSCVNVCE